jgi:hypothetical protein
MTMTSAVQGALDMIAAAHGVDAETAKQAMIAQMGGIPLGRPRRPGRDRRAGRVPGVRPRLMDHRKRLRDRRRHAEGDLSRRPGVGPDDSVLLCACGETPYGLGVVYGKPGQEGDAAGREPGEGFSHW